MYHEFHSLRDVKKTRKNHRCFLCRLDIPKGTRCTYEAGKFDGEFYGRYSHDECSRMWSDINQDSDNDDWLEFESMAEVYPHESFKSWQLRIGQKYNVLNGDGL